MAVDVLIRLEKEIKKSNRTYLVKELKNNSNSEEENKLLKNISKIDQEILELKNTARQFFFVKQILGGK